MNDLAATVVAVIGVLSGAAWELWRYRHQLRPQPSIDLTERRPERATFFPQLRSGGRP
jgi:hypothetical protein